MSSPWSPPTSCRKTRSAPDARSASRIRKQLATTKRVEALVGVQRQQPCCRWFETVFTNHARGGYPTAGASNLTEAGGKCDDPTALRVGGRCNDHADRPRRHSLVRPGDLVDQATP